LFDTLVFIDTGTAVPGVREFVEHAAEWLGKPLKVYGAMPGEYRRIVLGGADWRGVMKQGIGFPGPAQHPRCYTNLKERALEKMKADLKGKGRKARVLALTGLRRGESERRKHRAPITRRGSLVFANPLSDWTNQDLHRYRREYDLIESDVAALLHRSGECNCGAYATPDERRDLMTFFPEWWEDFMAPIEREAKAMGLPCHTWGSSRGLLDLPNEPGELCSDCQLRFEKGTA
jgi:3'-phosphoadenosine 5'-phosphosulfate sulfotransferase (PAPS reductase)/FAD synthetase